MGVTVTFYRAVGGFYHHSCRKSTKVGDRATSTKSPSKSALARLGGGRATELLFAEHNAKFLKRW